MASKKIVFLVSFAAFLGPFSQNIYTPILPELKNSFETTPFLINFSISIFTIFLAIMQMVYGPLTDKVGRRKVLLMGLAIYILASLGCFLSPTIYLLLLFRSIQAIGIAAGSVVAVTIIGDLFEGKQRGKAMGTFQMMVALGPVLGPVIGGFIGGLTDFHYVFLVLLLVGIIIFTLHFFTLQETKPASTPRSFQITEYFSILKNRVASAVIFVGFIQYYTLYNFLVFLPIILTEEYGLSAEQKGLLFLPLSLFIVIGSLLGGFLQGKMHLPKVLILSTSLSVVSVIFFLLTAEISLLLLIIGIALFGLFMGISLPSQTTLLTQQFLENRATAVGMYNFSRYLGMSFGPIAVNFLYNLGGIIFLYGFAAAVFTGAIIFAYRRLILAKSPASISK